jgi:hypothetical protein
MTTAYDTDRQPPAPFIEFEVVAAPMPYAILGRDVLNHFILTLNGKDLTFALQDP